MLCFILISILILLLSLTLIFNYKKEGFQNYDYKNSDHFNKYIDSIHPYQYKNKISNFKHDKISKNFKKKYLSLLTCIPKKYMSMLTKYTNKIDNLCLKKQITILNNIPWKFIMSLENLESGMPYTIDNYIILNESMLKEEYDNYQYIENDNFINTLIHEKIHILQRNYQNQFDEFYLRNYRFLFKKIDIEILPVKIKKIYMTNPDSNSSIWIYKYNNLKLYPILTKNGNYFKDISFKTNDLSYFDIKVLKNSLNFDNHISFYHPNEIFACSFSHSLLNDNIEKSCLNFIRSL